MSRLSPSQIGTLERRVRAEADAQQRAGAVAQGDAGGIARGFLERRVEPPERDGEDADTGRGAELRHAPRDGVRLCMGGETR